MPSRVSTKPWIALKNSWRSNRRRVMKYALWIVQVLLALLFLFAEE